MRGRPRPRQLGWTESAGFAPRFSHGDAEVLRVQRWLQGRLDKPASLADMAAVAGLPTRTLQRRFKVATGLPVSGYLRRLRTARARELLELSSRPLDEVAWAVGYEDERALRRVMVDEVGLTPRDYRARFGVGG